jgi:hypothetical protein
MEAHRESFARTAHQGADAVRLERLAPMAGECEAVHGHVDGVVVAQSGDVFRGGTCRST